MNWVESTQLQNWRFSADQLRRLREANRERCLDAIQQALARSSSAASLETVDSQASGASPTTAPEPLSLEEELALLKYYGSKLQHVSRELRLPRRVLGTALAYLQRSYLSFSCMEQDPQQLLLTCLYLACKIEEHYISAAELGRLTGVPADLILRTELVALQGLKFDLIVYSPYKSIEGFFEDIKEAAAEAGSSEAAAAAAGLDPGMASLSEQQLGKARGVAYSAADALLLSDAPLLHAPGQLALAAVRSGFNKLGIKLQRYLERVSRRGSGSDDWQAGLARLQAVLSELDRLGAEGARSVEQEQMAAIDRKLKACRAVLAGGSREGSAAKAKAKAKAEKAARKAAKAAEQRSAAEASVGVTTVPPAAAAGTAAADAIAAGAEQPPTKRQRQGNS
ncbi:hypothetical protein ABPG77_008311 [Micractinium sp. CCAP 211/92]